MTAYHPTIYLTETEFRSLYRTPEKAPYEKSHALREALTIVVHNDNAALLKKMVERGLSVDYMFRRGQTLLSEAIYQNSPISFQFLLNHKANPNLAGASQHLPLCVVLRKNYYSWFKPLLDKGANPNLEIWEGEYLQDKIVGLPQFAELFNLMRGYGYKPELIHQKNKYNQTLLEAMLQNYSQPKEADIHAVIDCAQTIEAVNSLAQELAQSVEKQKGFAHKSVFETAERLLQIQKERVMLEGLVNKPHPSPLPQPVRFKI